VKVIVLQELGSAVLQNFGVYAPASELGLNCLNAPFGFIKCSCDLPLPKIPIFAVFETGESQDNIEFLTMHLKLTAPPSKANGFQEGSDEIKHLICTLIVLLGFEKHPLKTPPLG
jgi:hypothetical protein